MTQTDVAVAVVNASCQTTPKSNACNSEQDLKTVLIKTQNLATDDTGAYRVDSAPCLPDDLASEIVTNQHPICCHIKWNSVTGDGENGHFVVVMGYDQASGEVCIADSRDQTISWLAYSTVATAYDGHGMWDFTYWTAP
jgi:hypothetical protein